MNSIDRKARSGDHEREVRDLRIGDGRVRLVVLGQGRPALFLHGVSAHGRSWRAVAAAFADACPQWSCWLPDLLGRGGSDAGPNRSYGLADEVRRTRELVSVMREPDGPGGFPSLLVGHSHGAALALALACAEPSVRGLVLSNPVTADLRRPAVLGALRYAPVRNAVASVFAPLHRPLGRLVLRRAAGPHYRVPEEIVGAYSEQYRDPVRARTLMKILSDWRPADLAALMPTRPLAAHVVAGAHDPRIPVGAAERLARDLGCELTLVEDGGHVLPEQHPELLAEIVGRVAGRVRASEA